MVWLFMAFVDAPASLASFPPHKTKQNKTKERDQFSKLKSWPPRSPKKSANFLASCNLGAVDGARSGRALLSPSIPLQRYCNFAIHLPAFLARFDFSTSATSGCFTSWAIHSPPTMVHGAICSILFFSNEQEGRTPTGELKRQKRKRFYRAKRREGGRQIRKQKKK